MSFSRASKRGCAARRRFKAGTTRRSRSGEIVLDPSRQQLTVRGKDVALAPKEFALLRVLMENNGRVVTRQTLAR